MSEMVAPLRKESVFVAPEQGIEEGEIPELIDNASEDIEAIFDTWIKKARKEAELSGNPDAWQSIFYSPEMTAKMRRDVERTRDEYCENQELGHEQEKAVRMVYSIGSLVNREVDRLKLGLSVEEYETEERSYRFSEMAKEDAAWQHDVLAFIGRYRNDPLAEEGMESLWKSAHAIFRERLNSDLDIQHIKSGILGTVTAGALLESAGIKAYIPTVEADVHGKVDLIGLQTRPDGKKVHLLLQIKTSQGVKEPRFLPVEDVMGRFEVQEMHNEVRAAKALKATAGNHARNTRESTQAFWVEMPSHVVYKGGENKDQGVINQQTGLPNKTFITNFRPVMGQLLTQAGSEARGYYGH